MNSAAENRICPGCGAAIPANAPQGICPKCLMAAAAVATEAGPTGGQRPEPPSVERLAAAFPQLEVLELIGQGGMGAVYKARQKQLDRIVALKVLPPGIGGGPAFAERFTREAKALAKLLHPNIVALFEFGQADGIYYLLMEYVDGVSLGQLLRASRVSPREALAIVPQICDALQYAHDQGIVHRDIKPENILLDRRGRVKVADFGLAKLAGAGSSGAGSPLPAAGAHGVTRPAEDLTGAGKIMGTPNYMAPEQVEHPGEVDHRADIYALGVVFYQMLTGELPGKPIAAPSSKVQIDVRLDEVVLRALEKKPELRYQQASVLKTQVETIATTPPGGGTGEEAHSEAPSQKPYQPQDFWQKLKNRLWPPVVIRRNGQRVINWPAVALSLVKAFLLAPLFGLIDGIIIGVHFGEKPGILVGLGVTSFLLILVGFKITIRILRGYSRPLNELPEFGPSASRPPADSGVPPAPAVRSHWTNQGIDYRSKATLFGLPLLHVTSGVDPQTGRQRVAKGIIAIGGVAQGVVAFGGVAMGGFAFGGLAIGVFAFGGCALGLAAFGGGAMALIAAVGGGTVAPIAIGGGAIGYLAFGGGAIGVHVLDAVTRDPVAEQFFLPWAKVLMDNFQWLNAALIVLAVGIGLGVPLWILNRVGRQTAGTTGDKGLEGASGTARASAPSTASRFSRTAIVGGCFGILGVLALVLYAVIGDSNLLDEGPSNVLAAFTALCLLISAILGWVTVSQIRRSARQLRGMWLAVSDGLLFPLLALDGLLAFQASTIVQTFSAVDAVFAQLGIQPASNEQFEWLAGIATVFICAVANTLIAWGVWRAVNNRSAGLPPADSENSASGKWACGPLLVVTLGPSLVMTIVPWQEGWTEGLAAAIGSVALALALVWGLISWRKRLGKCVVIATSALFAALIVAAAILSLVVVPARRALLQAAFGPVTECTLPTDEDGWTPLFDLDHNQLVPDPKPGDTAVDRVQHLAQLKKPGVAIHHDGQTQVIAVSGMVMHDTDADQWEKITDLDTLAGPVGFGFLSGGVTVPGAYQTGDYPGKLPLTIFFRTPACKLGLLQITGFTENPRGVKIRYKRVPGVATMPAAAAAAQHLSIGPVKQVSAATARNGDIGVRLAALGTVESSNSVVFAIPEDYCQEVIRKFDAHQAMTVEAYDRTWEKRFGHGLLTGVDNQIDTATGTLKCRASLTPEGDNLMVRGLFLNIRLLLEVKHGVTLVPVYAILHDPQGAFVWVIQPDETVSRRQVQTGAIDGAKIEIQSGLSPGEVVAGDGFNGLQEGQQIRYKLVLTQRDEGK
jgi:serine/threonine protein kinase